MPGFWMAPYRGNQGKDRATFFAGLPHPVVREKPARGVASFMPAMHTGATPADPLGNRSGARPKSPALL